MSQSHGIKGGTTYEEFLLLWLFDPFNIQDILHAHESIKHTGGDE